MANNMEMMTALEIYEKLLHTYGRPRWWSDDPYVVMVQAILVQHTAWASVEKVTSSLGNDLSPEKIAGLREERLTERIRPCGFGKAKAAAIQRLTMWYKNYQYDPEILRKKEKGELRSELLRIKGIGEETADVLLTFAFHKPSFVVDEYTRRFLGRLGYTFENDKQIRAFFESGLPADYRIYGWYHWLILDHGIQRCKKTPLCEDCCFQECMFSVNSAVTNLKGGK